MATLDMRPEGYTDAETPWSAGIRSDHPRRAQRGQRRCWATASDHATRQHPGTLARPQATLIGGKTMVGLTFAVLAVVVLGLVVIALGLAPERLVRRHRAKPPPQP
jgi:hypothetical protein